MRDVKFFAHFDRFGCRDWCICTGPRSRPRVRKTRAISFLVPTRTTIRRRQPKAVIKGHGKIHYTRILTVIT